MVILLIYGVLVYRTLTTILSDYHSAITRTGSDHSFIIVGAPWQIRVFTEMSLPTHPGLFRNYWGLDNADSTKGIRLCKD